jgi:DNA (cytosine-5)-methyltransferase 1
LAGPGTGLAGERSGTFKPFWALISALNAEGRAPALVVLENVVGALSSRGGRDFAFLMECLAREGYAGGALVMDAADFLPQSRPRLFVVGIQRSAFRAQGLAASGPISRWHPATLRKAFRALPDWLLDWWHWWCLPEPPPRRIALSDVLEENPPASLWHSPAETKRLLSLMDPAHLERIHKAQSLGIRVVGTLYRRTRPDPVTGRRRQRAEVRFDGVAGCLRTPAGGSSRQIVVIVEGRKVRTRLLSAREAARLMGVPDAYPIPASYNEAYHLFGDGLAVPVVSWLSRHLLEPLLLANAEAAAA